jgi:hypothetical protein
MFPSTEKPTIIQAVKFIRPRKAPAMMMTAIAAKTNWKYTIVAMGKFAFNPDAGRMACARF